ncbi:hypothetical protein BKA93DRAFT_810234 [Sparassis latifolia]|uniref:Uncharacterized protein n=1 Tax=Sparassis crispa TaxID=139825 RepID=A0A401GZ18_9APHY|nr:hypothetical protein SCP_1100750 [Sparassis crispa]GBE87399.1 hypothetical protein SCP_1100750 [Sparassis crispa]
MAPQRCERSYFDVLPNELLNVIKGNIHKKDLRMHVCFYKSSSRALYGRDDFRKKLCWLNGLGLMPGEIYYCVSWRLIAFECIEEDGFCDHPKCGGRRLEQNGACMDQ